MAVTDRLVAVGPLVPAGAGGDDLDINSRSKENVVMTGTDVHFLTLLARQREAELNRELHLRRLLREANSSARPAEPTLMPAPVMRAWLRLAAGQRPVGG